MTREINFVKRSKFIGMADAEEITQHVLSI